MLPLLSIVTLLYRRKIILLYLSNTPNLNHERGEERGGPPPCSDQQQQKRFLDCCRSDVRSDMARTSHTSDVRRASSQSGCGVLPFRGGALPRLQRPWPVVASSSTPDREVASGSPGAASRCRQGHRKRQMIGKNDLADRVRRLVVSPRSC